MSRKRQFGNVRKLPSNRLQARYTGPHGEVVTAPKTFDSRRDADRWLTLQHAQLLGGSWSDPNAGHLLLKDFAEDWLASHTALKPKTRVLYRDLLTRFVTDPTVRATATTVCPDLGDHRLRDITSGHVDRWFRWVTEVSEEASLRRHTVLVGTTRWRRALRAWAREQGFEVRDTGRLPQHIHEAWVGAGSPELVSEGRSPAEPGRAQAANAYRLLNAVMSSAVRAGLVPANPCRVRGGTTSSSSSTPPATPAELDLIAKAMPERYRTAVVVAAFGALRAGEVFGLARRHVDLSRGTVDIERSVSYLPGRGRSFGSPKSTAGRRRVHLPPPVMEALQQHMAQFVGPGPDALVFATSRGTALHSSNRSSMFRRAAVAAGRPDLRFHDLRHTGATLAAQYGASLPDLMRRLGHSTPRASLIYLHSSEAADKAIANRLSDAFQMGAS